MFKAIGNERRMFTGLVEEKGEVVFVRHIGDTCRIRVVCNLVHQDVGMGDSICVNGCCLTVVEIDENQLEFDAGSETLSRTNLGKLGEGSPVNLERSLQPSSRMGGHYVSGHVDALGTVKSRNDDGEWAEFWFEVPEHLTRQMAGKGSVTVDGISLTLVDVKSDCFSVALVPHTLSVTTLGQRDVGDEVNIETDLLAKYVERQLTAAGVIGK